MSSVTKPQTESHPHTNNTFSIFQSPSNPCAKVGYQGYKTLKHSGTHALAGLIMGINPLAGAIIGATSYASSTGINWLCKKAHICQDNIFARMSRAAFSACAGIGLGILAAKTAGFSLSFGSVVLLKIASVGVLLAGNIVIGSIVLLAMAATAYLATRYAKPSIANEGQRLLHNVDNLIKDTSEHIHRLVE